jgi:hypothetical protein
VRIFANKTKTIKNKQSTIIQQHTALIRYVPTSASELFDPYIFFWPLVISIAKCTYSQIFSAYASAPSLQTHSCMFDRQIYASVQRTTSERRKSSRATQIRSNTQENITNEHYKNTCYCRRSNTDNHK